MLRLNMLTYIEATLLNLVYGVQYDKALNLSEAEYQLSSKDVIIHEPMKNYFLKPSIYIYMDKSSS